MGNSSDVLNNQILYYYLFHKKLELFFNRQHNPFFEINKKEIKLENIILLIKNYCIHGKNIVIIIYINII